MPAVLIRFNDYSV